MGQTCSHRPSGDVLIDLSVAILKQNIAKEKRRSDVKRPNFLFGSETIVWFTGQMLSVFSLPRLAKSLGHKLQEDDFSFNVFSSPYIKVSGSANTMARKQADYFPV